MRFPGRRTVAYLKIPQKRTSSIRLRSPVERMLVVPSVSPAAIKGVSAIEESTIFEETRAEV